MTDAKPKVRKKANRKPSRRKLLSPEQLQNEAVAKASRALKMDELACAHLCVEFSEEHAAATLGWDLAAVREVWNRPAVQRYLMEAQTVFLYKLASAKIRLLKKVEVNGTVVEQRLAQLMMMEPDETKGTIDGQVKAARTLAEIFGLLDNSDPLKNKTREELLALVQKAHGRVIQGNTQSEPRPQ